MTFLQLGHNSLDISDIKHYCLCFISPIHLFICCFRAYLRAKCTSISPLCSHRILKFNKSRVYPFDHVTFLQLGHNSLVISDIKHYCMCFISPIHLFICYFSAYLRAKYNKKERRIILSICTLNCVSSRCPNYTRCIFAFTFLHYLGPHL